MQFIIESKRYKKVEHLLIYLAPHSDFTAYEITVLTFEILLNKIVAALLLLEIRLHLFSDIFLAFLTFHISAVVVKIVKQLFAGHLLGRGRNSLSRRIVCFVFGRLFCRFGKYRNRLFRLYAPFTCGGIGLIRYPDIMTAVRIYFYFAVWHCHVLLENKCFPLHFSQRRMTVLFFCICYIARNKRSPLFYSQSCTVRAEIMICLYLIFLNIHSSSVQGKKQRGRIPRPTYCLCSVAR